MPGKPAVQVVIAGDTKGLDKALKHSSGALGSFGKTAAGVFGGLAIAKGVGLAIDGIQALGNFALGGIDKLDALGDATARLDGLVKGLGDTASKADLSKFGVDKNEQAQAALTIAKTGKALGLTGKQVKAIVPNLDEMAAQLASLGDGDVDKQAKLLAKALGGSSKAAKELGVKLPKGGDALANYQALMKTLAPQLDKATDGQASLADVGDRWDATLANLQLQLAGFLEKLAPVVSQLLDLLLPALQKLVDTVGPAVEEFFSGLAGAFSDFLEGGGAQGVTDAFGAIMDILLGIADFWATNIAPLWGRIAGAIIEAIGPLIPKIQEVWDKLRPVLETLAGFFRDVIVPILVDTVIPAIGDVLGIILDLIAKGLDALNPALKTAGDVFGDIVDAIKPVVDWFGDVLDVIGDVIDALSNIKVPDIKLPFGIGGPAGTAALAAGARAGGEATIVIQTGVGDPVAIGRQVARYLGAYRLRGGSVL